MTLPDGSETYVEYDKSDRITKVIRGAGKEKRENTYEYDKSGNVIKETDCNGNSIKYEYDSMNRQIRITDKEAELQGFYDDSGNVIKRVTPKITIQK